MKRREFIALAGIVAACPVRVGAQSARKRAVPLVGYLSPGSQTPPSDNVFVEGLRDLDYVVGQNIKIEYRLGNGAFDRLSDFAAELVALDVDVIVAILTQAALAAKKATSSIPIVMAGVADPVGARLIASLSHPGGNVTGTSSIAADLVGKQLELIQELCPQGVFNRNALESGKLGISATVTEASRRSEPDLWGATSAIASTKPGGVPERLRGYEKRARPSARHLRRPNVRSARRSTLEARYRKSATNGRRK